MEFPDTEGLEVSRTDFAPDGLRAVLFGLRLRNPGASAKTVDVKVDVHSEVMSHYPWAWTTPDAGAFNRDDTGTFDDETLVFHDRGTPHPNAGPHDWVAVVGSTPDADDGEAGPGHWGPQSPPVLCTSEAQFWCDEGPFGKGTGGQLRHEVSVPAGGERTVWVAVAGSDQGARQARARSCAPRSRTRTRRWRPSGPRASRLARYSKVTLPADERLAEGIEWGKQNLLDLTQRADRLQVRDVNEGKDYPPPAGTLAHVGWIGAGYPDYPWIFATDAEYTAFAAVAAGQFEGDRGACPRPARRVGDPQRRLRQGRARGRRGRLGVLRQPRARGQHRRDGEVPEPRRAALALDRRRRAAPRALSLRRAQPALRHDAARRGR